MSRSRRYGELVQQRAPVSERLAGDRAKSCKRPTWQSPPPVAAQQQQQLRQIALLPPWGVKSAARGQGGFSCGRKKSQFRTNRRLSRAGIYVRAGPGRVNKLLLVRCGLWFDAVVPVLAGGYVC